jgi:hypothetical protein
LEILPDKSADTVATDLGRYLCLMGGFNFMAVTRERGNEVGNYKKFKLSQVEA